jgi:cell division protein FtsB
MMQQGQQQQGVAVKPEYVMDEAYREMATLMRENHMLKALIKQMREEQAQAQEPPQQVTYPNDEVPDLLPGEEN